MKTIRILLLTLAPLLLISTGCYKEGGIFGIKGTGDMYQEDRHVDSYDKIDMGISAKVFITQDQDESIVIEAQSNILDNIETYVSGSTLKFRFKRPVLKHDGITILISNPSYRSIEISGSGSVYNDTPLDCQDLDLHISGSGYMELKGVEVSSDLEEHISGSGNLHIENLQVGDDMRCTITGSGKIFNQGHQTVDYMKVNISGSGNINTLDLPADRVKTTISGSGNCKVWAVSELEAVISGSGSVYYVGNPTVNTVITGSGRVFRYD